MNRTRDFILVTFFTLLMVFVAACGNQPATTTSGDSSSQTGNQDAPTDVLKIGVVGPLSGAGAGWGLPLQYGIEMAAEKVN